VTSGDMEAHFISSDGSIELCLQFAKTWIFDV